MTSKVVLFLLAFVTVAQHAFAQDRMWFFEHSGIGRRAVVTQIDVTNGGRAWSVSAKWTISTEYPLTRPLLPFQGGRYLVWLAPADDGTSVLAYLDTQSGQSDTFPGFSFGGSSGGDRPSIAVDRGSSRVVVLDPRGIWLIDLHGASVELISLPAHPAETRRVEAAGGRVFVTRSLIFEAPSVLVIDRDSGAQLAEFPRTWELEFTRDEKSFFLSSIDPNHTQWLYHHDMATLRRVSAVPFPLYSTLIDNVRLTRSFATDGFSRLRVLGCRRSQLVGRPC